MIEFSDAEIEYLEGQRLGRLATADADGRPHVVPVSFRVDREQGTVECGGFHVETTKKWRDVRANPWAAIVVDDLVSVDPWTPRMIELRGPAEAVEGGGDALGPGFGAAFIRIRPTRKVSFGIDEAPG